MTSTSLSLIQRRYSEKGERVGGHVVYLTTTSIREYESEVDHCVRHHTHQQLKVIFTCLDSVRIKHLCLIDLLLLMTFFPRLTPISTKDSVTRYGLAVLSAIIALGGRSLLEPELHDSAPFALLFAAIAFSALYCGLGPSIAVIVLGVVGTDYLFSAPRFSFGVSNPGQIAGLVAFVFVIGSHYWIDRVKPSHYRPTRAGGGKAR